MVESAKKHALFLTIPCLILLYTGYQLLMDFRDDYHDAQGQAQIGKATTVTDDVRRRPSDRFKWYGVKADQALYAKDSLFTGSESHATLTFDDGGTIEMSENSLIILEKSTDKISIDFIKGNLAFLGGDKGLILKSQGKTVKVEHARGVISHKDGNLSLNIKEGSVTVHSGQETKSLQKREILQFGANNSSQIIRLQTDLLEPKPDSSMLTQSGISSVTFKWNPIADYTGVQLETSADSHFVSSKMVLPVSDAWIKKDLPLGPCFWRLTKSGLPISETRQFKVEKMLPLIPIQPENQKLIMVDLPKEILFRWTGAAYYSDYTLQVSSDPRFQVSLQSERIHESTTALLKMTMPGVYYWRIASRPKNSIQDEVSTVQAFRIQTIARAPTSIPSPEPTPIGAATIIVPSFSPSPTVIPTQSPSPIPPPIPSLPPTPTALSLLLQSYSPTPSIEPSQAPSSEPNPSPTPVPVPSRTAPIPIKKAPAIAVRKLPRPVPPTPVLIPNNSEIHQNGGQGHGTSTTTYFTWSRPVSSASFILEISRDPKFLTTTRSFKLKNNFYIFHFNGLPLGDYWWRVKSVSQSGTSEPSIVFRFTIKP